MGTGLSKELNLAGLLALRDYAGEELLAQFHTMLPEHALLQRYFVPLGS